MTPTTFKQTARLFIRKVIRTRQGLMRRNCSYLPQQWCEKTIAHLRYWSANATTPAKMASIVVNNYDKLQWLIPGRGSASHERLIDELNQLRHHAALILTN